MFNSRGESQTSGCSTAKLASAISPMRYGAGVKLKTIEALQFGVPIVATSVGSEGIQRSERVP